MIEAASSPAWIPSHVDPALVRVFMQEWLDRIGCFALRPDSETSCATGSVLSVSRLELCWPA
jgi:hypothetical protein